jgi:hypothetical protein
LSVLVAVLGTLVLIGVVSGFMFCTRKVSPFVGGGKGWRVVRLEDGSRREGSWHRGTGWFGWVRRIGGVGGRSEQEVKTERTRLLDG